MAAGDGQEDVTIKVFYDSFYCCFSWFGNQQTNQHHQQPTTTTIRDPQAFDFRDVDADPDSKSKHTTLDFFMSHLYVMRICDTNAVLKSALQICKLQCHGSRCSNLEIVEPLSDFYEFLVPCQTHSRPSPSERLLSETSSI
jgi:hypothetical protein